MRRHRHPDEAAGPASGYRGSGWRAPPRPAARRDRLAPLCGVGKTVRRGPAHEGQAGTGGRPKRQVRRAHGIPRQGLSCGVAGVHQAGGGYASAGAELPGLRPCCGARGAASRPQLSACSPEPAIRRRWLSLLAGVRRRWLPLLAGGGRAESGPAPVRMPLGRASALVKVLATVGCRLCRHREAHRTQGRAPPLRCGSLRKHRGQAHTVMAAR